MSRIIKAHKGIYQYEIDMEKDLKFYKEDSSLVRNLNIAHLLNGKTKVIFCNVRGLYFPEGSLEIELTDKESATEILIRVEPHGAGGTGVVIEDAISLGALFFRKGDTKNCDYWVLPITAL